MARDDRKRNILWWRIATGYAWSIAVRELEPSPLWSPRAKAQAGVLAGVAISLPVAFGIGVPYMYWLLTRGGRWKRYGFSSAVVVNPFRRSTPVEVRAALAELQNQSASEACAVATRARP